MPKQMHNKVEPIIFYIEGEAKYGLKVVRLCEDFPDSENKFTWKRPLFAYAIFYTNSYVV